MITNDSPKDDMVIPINNKLSDDKKNNILNDHDAVELENRDEPEDLLDLH